MSIARRHHYVPKGYLAGFTDDGTRNGKLTVFDLKSRKIFRTSPANVASMRDFNRVDLDGLPPDFVERELGDFEGKAISSIRQIQARGEPMTDDERSDIVTLITLLIVRNPRRRREISDFRRRAVRGILDPLASDRDLYEHHFANAKRDGSLPEDAELKFEDAAEFIESDSYDVEVSTTESISLELGGFDNIFETLASRWWSLAVADTGAPEFVTSDHPVAVVYKDPTKRGPIGFGLPYTEVSFPLGPRHAVIGVLEKPLPPRFTVLVNGVAVLNSRTVYWADRQVYSTSRRVSILKSDGVVEFDVRRYRQDQ